VTGLPLSDLRILIVEDDYYLATDARISIEKAGGTVVGPFATTEEARAALKAGGVDLAILDINLGSGPRFDLARHLHAAGLPFLFATGYDQAVVPEDLKSVARLEKPFRAVALIDAAASLHQAASGSRP
jgi:DNA-binding NtrC family response regulator